MLQWEKAVKVVFLESWHSLCTFHIMQNDVKHLAEHDDEESATSPKQEVKGSNKEPSILSYFSACMYEDEDEETFKQAFNNMRTKVSKQTWLDSVYKVREK
jgi:zinc finger SWIM domain-containing protein 3